MLSFLQFKKNTPGCKQHISITGTLASKLLLGHPAVYLYNGTLIRTNAVEAILEMAPDHVEFETNDSIYTISSYKLPNSGVKQIA